MNDQLQQSLVIGRQLPRKLLAGTLAGLTNSHLVFTKSHVIIIRRSVVQSNKSWYFHEFVYLDQESQFSVVLETLYRRDPVVNRSDQLLLAEPRLKYFRTQT